MHNTQNFCNAILLIVYVTKGGCEVCCSLIHRTVGGSVHSRGVCIVNKTQLLTNQNRGMELNDIDR